MQDKVFQITNQIKQRIFQIEALTYQVYKLAKELEKITGEESEWTQNSPKDSKPLWNGKEK